MAALAPAELCPQLPVRQVELVMHRDDLSWLDLVEARQAGDRAAGEVHVRQRLDEDKALRIRTDTEPRLRHIGDGAAVTTKPSSGALRQQIGDHEPHVVAVPRVLPTRVPEPRDKPHRYGLRGRSLG